MDHKTKTTTEQDDFEKTTAWTALWHPEATPGAILSTPEGAL